jgi:predicted transcriptional regulator
MGSSEEELKKLFIDNLSNILPEAKIQLIKKSESKEYEKIDLTLKIQIGNIEKILLCEIKSKGEPRYIYQAITKIKSLSKDIKNSVPVIVAPYIGAKGREISKEFQVGYIDLNGNVWLNIDTITIEKEGKDKQERDYRYAKDIFAKKSSRILKMMLLNPEKLWKLEELSEKINSSLSYVHRIIKTVEKFGYISYEKREGIRLTRPEALLLDWAKQYKILEKNVIKGYYTFKPDISEAVKQIQSISSDYSLEYGFTLFTGAQFIMPYVRQANVYVYFKEYDIKNWVEKLELKPVEAGPNFYIIQPYDEHIFWGMQNINSIKIVSNIQLFLDLFNFPTRGEEQAIALKNEKIKF